MKLGRASLLTIGLIAVIGFAFAREAKAQGAVAFAPNIGQFNDGAFLSVTPVVSADRRYVRLVNIQPVFNQLDSFEVFTIPAAVAGVGGGGFGGFGGLGGGGGFGGRSMGLGNNRMMGLTGFNDSNPLSSFTAFANMPDARQQVVKSKTAKSKKATVSKKKLK
jgi:hypothetical protein